MHQSHTSSSLSSTGLIYGFAAYGMWGVFPLYFHIMKRADAWEILAHRIVWSALMLVIVLTLLRQWKSMFAILRQPKQTGLLIASALFIAGNWLAYIYGVQTGRVMHCSLGYFITPLVNIAMGLLLFRESLRTMQWVGLFFAIGGMLFLVFFAGGLSWITITLAFSFAFYGLIRKVAKVNTLQGLTVETVILTPVSLGYLIYLQMNGTGAWRTHGFDLDLLLMTTGPATVIPLFCFGQAARMLPLSIVGFLQYIAPSMQFLLSVLFFHEPFGWEKAIGYSLIWMALLLVLVDSLWQSRLRRIRESSSEEFDLLRE